MRKPGDSLAKPFAGRLHAPPALATAMIAARGAIGAIAAIAAVAAVAVIPAMLLAVAAPSPAAAQFEMPERAQLMLEADRTSYAPGETARIALLLEIDLDWHVNSRTPTYDYLIPTEARILPPEGWQAGEVTYPEGVMRTFAFVDEPISVYEDQVVLNGSIRIPEAAQAGVHPVTVTLRYQACDHKSCEPPVDTQATIDLTIGEPGELVAAFTSGATGGGTDAGTANASESSAPGGRTLAGFLFLGVLGGLLLNAMPCVLPVLSLKVMGLVKSSAHGRRGVTIGSLATASGIIVSFLALAGAAVAAKVAGATVGWGVQFQQPIFVVFLTLVVLLFCLNLWGQFEVPLPSKLAGWAASTGGEGLPGHFTAGLFATLLATPCSAPFLGTAVGFALSQSAGKIFAIFAAVGLGMALPYLLIAVAPSTVKLLPKPGAWMESFKIFMGFLLAAAAVWLLYVLAAQVSAERLAFIELSLLVVALFVWARKATSGWRSKLATAAVLATAVFSLVLAANADAANRSAATTENAHLIEWLTFDRAEAERLADSGQLVFVDVTADWCFTCKVNERLALETTEVAEAFERFSVIAMKADWTNRDDTIAAFLSDHGRYGIPFYLLYRPGEQPHVFGELITKEGIVEEIEAAAGSSLRTAALSEPR